ncbi:hypothetical protein O181_007689 [Austropuccinia psidii MF-1]|uniref:Uncharacterized protein n=1 Tax=Austropuccinia psidii MF-1 TaxID=1389203 RepID=A0A9Q3BMG7_9BASI|nr:hypothetical protein [Austropuccinia psidii MF-1]
MEIDRRKNLRFSEWALGSGTPDSGDTDSEGTETHILAIRSSELHNELFSAVMKPYAKYKHCGILLQLLQQKYRSPELESQLEGPLLSVYKDNKFFSYRCPPISLRKAQKLTNSERQRPYIPDPEGVS